MAQAAFSGWCILVPAKQGIMVSAKRRGKAARPAPKAKPAPKANASAKTSAKRKRAEAKRKSVVEHVPLLLPPDPAAAILSDDGEPELEKGSCSGSGPRRLKRWDSGQAVTRVMKDKLSGFDPLEIAGAVGKTTGKSPKDYILDHLRQSKTQHRSYLASAFWVSFFGEFDLAPVRFSAMASVDDSKAKEEINDELLTAVAHAHDPNPAQRRTDTILSYLEYSAACNLTELKFMISSSREGPTMIRKSSLKVLVHILKYIGKHSLHTKWPAFWKQSSGDFDTTFASHVAMNPPDAAIRAQYVHGLRSAFDTLVPFTNVQKVEDAVAAKNEVPCDSLQEIMKTKVGALLYKSEGLVMRYKVFIKTIDERLSELEDLSYSSADVVAFNDVMTMESKEVMRCCPAFERKVCSLKFLGEAMDPPIASINDEWSFRLAAKMTSQAVSTNQLPRLPWEVLLFDKAKLAGYPETILIPAEHLEAARNARVACNRLLKGYECVTFSDMARIVAAHSETMSELYRFWSLDAVFLKNHARAVGERILRGKIMDCLPESHTAHHFTFKQALTKVAAIKTLKLTAAVGSAIEDDVDVVFSLLSSLDKGHAPSHQSVLKMSAWCRQVLGRCEHFLTAMVPPEGSTGRTQVLKMQSGRLAMQYLWGQFQSTAVEKRTLDQAAPFRQFAWMLTQEQGKEIDAFVNSGIAAYQANFLKAALCDKPAAVAVAGAASEGADVMGGSSSSTCALAKLPFQQMPKGSKEKADPLAERKSRLLEMFKN